MKKTFFLMLSLILAANLYAQDYDENAITTPVTFLTITPDAKASGMGDIGAATDPDITSIFHNPAKYSFIDKKSGFETSYSPWLHKLATGMSIMYLAGYHKINDRQAFAASLKYFSIGEIQFTDEYGNNTIPYKPNEFAITGSYSMKLTDNLSGAVSLRAILSNLTGGGASQLGFAASGDLSVYYQKPITINSTDDAQITWGLNLSNIGSKISYGSEITAFIPANFKTGVGFKYFLDEYNSIQLGLDMNKLMVPSPAIYDANNNVIVGTDPQETSTVEGIFVSFADAPNGMSEEWHEIMWGTGLEYGYNDLLFARAGFFYENPHKGNRRYLTAGFGFKYNVLNLDFSYLIPIQTVSPLESTMRFTLSFYFDRNKQNSPSPVE